MIIGAAQMDGRILVVLALDGTVPHAKEHILLATGRVEQRTIKVKKLRFWSQA